MAGVFEQLLREDQAASFSDLWYRVGPTSPRISPHTRIVRQQSGSHVDFVVEDPAGGHFYRISEAAAFFVGLLDGRRSADAAWEACVAQLGDAAPTQRECLDVLSRLQFFGLLSTDLPELAGAAEIRRREVRERRLKRRLGAGVSPSIPLLNPEWALERSAHLWRAVWSWPTLVAWALLMGAAVWVVASHAGELGSALNGVLDPANVVWLAVVFVLLRAIHELGHATACKALGGRCTEIGLLFFAYVFPLPYCDASSAWRFPEVRRRVVVSLGGVLAESIPAAVAAILWAYAEPGLLRNILFNVMLVSGVSTLVFNLNPLLRYDGYYVLSDLLGIPNLAQRSTEALKTVVERGAFNARAGKPPPVRSGGEFAILLVYALLSWPYRFFIMAAAAGLLLSHPSYLTLGVVLAGLLVVMMVVVPLGKGAWYLATSPRLLGRRWRAVLVTGGTLAAIVGLVGVTPWSSAAYVTGIIEPVRESPVRADADGFLEAWLAEPGAMVDAGQPIAVLRNVDVTTERQIAAAALEGAQAELLAASGGPAGERRIRAIRVAHLRSLDADARARADRLTIRAPAAGRLLPAPGITPDDVVGTFVRRGVLVARVASDGLKVRLQMDDQDHALVFGRRAFDQVPVEVRARGEAWRVVPGRVTRVGAAASRDVRDAALTAPAGGEIHLDPRETERPVSLRPLFDVEIQPDASVPSWQPGLRAVARLGAAPEPLAARGWRWLRRYFSDRVQL